MAALLALLLILCTSCVPAKVTSGHVGGREDRMLGPKEMLEELGSGTYYLSMVVSLLMLIPVLHLAPPGQARAADAVPWTFNRSNPRIRVEGNTMQRN